MQKNSTPVQPALPSPRSGTTSPEPPKQPTTEDKDEDALAEMMCSLVTNNTGETRYIGMPACDCLWRTDVNTISRIIFGVLNILSKGHSMGEPEDGG